LEKRGVRGVIPLSLACLKANICNYLPKFGKLPQLGGVPFLEIRKGDQRVGQYNISDINSFISKHIVLNGDYKDELILKREDGKTNVLFFTELPKVIFWSKKQWNAFAEKLAISTGKAFRKEVWVGDYEGKMSLLPASKTRTSNKMGPVIFALLMTFSSKI
jgi:hypothetical protein